MPPDNHHACPSLLSHPPSHLPLLKGSWRERLKIGKVYIWLIYVNPEWLVVRLIDEMQGISWLFSASAMIASLCLPVSLQASSDLW